MANIQNSKPPSQQATSPAAPAHDVNEESFDYSKLAKDCRDYAAHAATEINAAYMQARQDTLEKAALSKGQAKTLATLLEIRNLISNLKSSSANISLEQQVDMCVQTSDTILSQARLMEYDIRFYFGYHAPALSIFQEGERYITLIARSKLGPLPQ